MNITYCIVIVILASVFLSRVAAESKVVDAASDLKAKNDGNGIVNGTINPVKNDKDVNLKGNDSVKQQEERVGGEQKKANNGPLKDEPKQKQGSESKSHTGSDMIKPPVVREKCDSSSNSCTDHDKTLVACLRFQGKETPERSLLIQNKGNVTLKVTISAPDSVHLEKKKVELREKEDTEISVNGEGNGQFITLTAGNGDCRLDISDQSVHDMEKLNGDPKATFFNNLLQTSFIGFLFLGALATAASALMCVFLRRRSARKAPKYQMLDMELPVSHGSKPESGSNEGWDDSWGDNWDDEEAPTTPSFPTTPSRSTTIASRKYNKAGRKD